VPGTPDSVASFVGSYSAHAWEMLGQLQDALRDRHAAASHRRPAGDPFWESYIRGLFELTRAEHVHNASLVPADDPRELLDVAGGHGAFAMAMCTRFTRLRATVLDLPASVAVGRRIVQEEGFAQRVSFREGDALREPLGERIDVISAFNLLHHLDPQDVRGLLERVRVEPGTEPSRAGAMSAVVYFASSGTRNYSSHELRGWLADAGFARVEVHRAGRSPWRLVYLARA